MRKDQIIILEKRGVVLISGYDAKDFLQNVITNDIKKVKENNSIFSAILTPQGKYLIEFFVIYHEKGYLLDCCANSKNELIENLSKYKLRSKVEIKDLSDEFVIGIINTERFKELQEETNSSGNTIFYRETTFFSDPRNKKLGARILSNLEKIYLTVKKLNLKIAESNEFYSHAYKLGIPEVGLNNLKNKLFGLEANFEELQAIDFKKGCFVGQENTARMKLKNKLRKKLVAIKTEAKLKIGSELKFKNQTIGKVLIDKPFPFALIDLYQSDENFIKKELMVENQKVTIINFNG